MSRLIRRQFRQLKLAWYLMWLGLKSEYGYRTAFWLQVVGMILNNTAIMIAMALLFARFGKVRGWSIHDTLLVFGLTTCVVGIAQLLFANVVGSRLAQRILDGQIDAFMLFPQSPLFHLTTRKLDVSGVGELLSGVVYIGLSGEVRSLRGVLLCVGGAILGAQVLKASGILVQSLTFWRPGVSDFGDVFMNGTLVPLNYPEPAFRGIGRFVLLGLFPGFFIGFLPARLARQFSWHNLALLAVVTIALNVAARLVFRRGLRRYESGNLMATNL